MKMAESSPNELKKKKNCGKRRNCSLQAISPFPLVFKRLVQQTRKNQGLSGKGLECELFPIQALVFPCLQYKSFEYTVGKDACNEQFPLFPHSFLYLFRELSAISIKFEMVVCKLFQFGSV